MPKLKSAKDRRSTRAPAGNGSSEPKKVLGVTLSFKSSRTLKRGSGKGTEQMVAQQAPETTVLAAPLVTVPDNTLPTFLYRGSQFLWGYTPDRQVCGMWSVTDPAGRPSQSWSILEHAKAWAVFQSLEPLAVEYKETDLPPS